MSAFWGPIAGAAIGALGSLFGGRKAEESAEYQNAVNANLQREFAQQGIQWRVEDARKAGLHPLYALGGAGAAFSPSAITVGDGGVGGALNQMGQGVSRAIAAVSTPEERALKELQVKEIESRIGENDARAAYFRSQAVRDVPSQAGVGFPGAGTGPLGTGAVTYPYVAVQEPGVMQLSAVDQYGSDFPGKFDMIKPKSVEIESVSPDAGWAAAGPARPGFQRHRLTRNLEMLLPLNQEGWSEGLESVPYAMYPMVFQSNVDYYAPGAPRLMAGLLIQELGANHPFARWLADFVVGDRPSVYREGDFVPGARPIRRAF